MRYKKTFANGQIQVKIFCSVCIHYCFRELEYPRSVCNSKKEENAKLIVVDDD